jgi:DNA-binding transcriptional ArsR family regulator
VNSPQTDRLFGVLADGTARRIFSRVHERPQSAKELRNQCDTSLKTIYRRLEDLQEVDLVSDVMCADEDGNHYTAYVSTIEEVDISIVPETEQVEVTIQDGDDVDQFVSIWDELQE